MNNNSQNEHNSSIKQALLDLEKVSIANTGPEATQLLKAVKTTLKILDKQSKLLKEADNIFNQHRYNDKRLHFTKINNFKKNQIVFNLADRECKVLLYMIGFMSQQNMVAIKQDELAKELRTGKREISSSLKGLVNKGCITKVFTDKKNGIGTVYMINPEIASVGKHDNCYLFQEITPSAQIDKFLATNKCTYGVTFSETHFNVSNNRPIVIKYNYLVK